MVSKSTDEVEARTKRKYSKASREGDRRRPFQSELPPKLSAFFSSRKCSSIPAKPWHFCQKTCTSIFYELFIALIPYSWQKGDVFKKNLWSIHCIDMVHMLSRYVIFTYFYNASIIRLIKGCDWEEELAVLCLHSYSTKKNTASGYFDFVSRWNDHLIKISTKQNAYKRTKTRTRLERKWHITYAILKVLKKTDTFCRGLWLRYRRHSLVTRATSATKSKNMRLTQRSLNQIMRIVNFRRILLKKKRKVGQCDRGYVLLNSPSFPFI